MEFTILTLFPHIFNSYFQESILKRAQHHGMISFQTHDIRDYATDTHHTVDDTPYGGGAGMVMKAEPILGAVEAATKTRSIDVKTEVIVFSVKGRPFTQTVAHDIADHYDRVLLISGRYEGIDERVVQALGADELSIGPYVLTDGDVASMVVVSAVSRLLPGVISLESLQEESHGNSEQELEYPHYTRPEVFSWKQKNYRVPKVLLSGDHKKVAEWRALHTTKPSSSSA